MRKLRLMRRGKTTVSNASIRMMKIRTMPAIDAHQCIDESSDDAGMAADSEMTLWRGVRRVQGLLYRLQFFQQAAQVARVKRVRAVASRFFRIVVDFHEHSVHARRHRRARQHRDKLRLASAHRGL